MKKDLIIIGEIISEGAVIISAITGIILATFLLWSETHTSNDASEQLYKEQIEAQTNSPESTSSEDPTRTNETQFLTENNQN